MTTTEVRETYTAPRGGTVSFTPWPGPVHLLDDDIEVIGPVAVTMEVGEPQDGDEATATISVELHSLPVNYGYKVTTFRRTSAVEVFYIAGNLADYAEAGVVDLGAVPRVDPKTLQPTTDNTAAWDAVFQLIEQALVDIETNSGAKAATFDRAGIADAATAAGTSRTVLLPAGVYNIASNLTVNVPVQLDPGAIIKPASGVTVTLAGGISAPRKQIFDQSAGGICIPRKTDWHPAWWGATGGADDSTAWQAMATANNASLVTGALSAALGNRIIAPTGRNNLMGVVLTNCEFFAGAGDCQFYPPAGTTSGTMFEFGTYTNVYGGHFACSGTQAVTLIKYSGARTHIDGAYIVPNATGSTGLLIDKADGTHATITPIISNVKIISGQHGALAANGGTGIVLYSSDGKFSNVTIGECSVGIDFQRGSGRFTNLHVWGCGTGLANGPDGSTFVNCYLETNLGWGADLLNADRVTFDGVYFWANGGTTPSTGGIRLLQASTSSCRDNVLTGCIFDDNVGIGLKLEGAVSGTEVAATRFGSNITQSGGGAATDIGVQVSATSTSTRLSVRGRNSDHITAVVDDQSGNAMVDMGTVTKVLAADVNNGTGSDTTYKAVFSLPVAAKDRWLVKGVLIFDTSQAADFKARLQATGLTGIVGHFSALAIAGSNTSSTASSVLPANVVTIAASAGNGIPSGGVGVGTLQRFEFSGYVSSTGGAGSTSLDLAAGAQNSDATVTTIRAGSYIEAKRVA